MPVQQFTKVPTNPLATATYFVTNYGIKPSWYEDVYAFHAKLIPSRIAHTPGLPTTPICKDLIVEEVSELLLALDTGNLPEIVDGALDSVYVLLGLLIHCGINPQPFWDEIQRSNIAKEGGETREDGKLLKPPGWTPPNIVDLLKAQGWVDGN